ncbi:MAG: WD40 repeat domain-containing protein [Flavobacteriales bacterium]
MQPISVFAGHRSAVYALARLGSADTFLSAGSDGTLVRWDLDLPAVGHGVAQLPRPVFSMLALDGLILAGLDDGAIHALDTAAKSEVRHLRLHAKGVFSSLAVQEGTLIASAGGEGSIGLWRWPAMELLRQIPLGDAKVRGLALSNDGHWLAASCNDGSVRVLDTVYYNELITLNAHVGGSYGVAFHPDKPALLTGGRDGHLRAWRMEGSWGKVLDVPAHQGSIYTIAFSPDGRHVATASRDKTAKVWDATSLEPVARLDRASGGHTHSVNALLWLEDGTLLTASDDKRIVRWTKP